MNAVPAFLAPPLNLLRGLPYVAWIILYCALTWGIFTFALFGALLCMVAIVRRQWFDNERLPFPLAQIYLSLIEPPQRGHALNGLLRRRGFWIVAATVFLLHAWNGMENYWPQYSPPIPVYYALEDLFSEPLWVYADFKLKSAAVFFTVGMTIGVVGTVAGSAVGLALIWVQNTYRIIRLAGDVYQIDYLLMKLTTADFLLIVSSTLLLSFLATVIPARHAGRLAPADVLRYE